MDDLKKLDPLLQETWKKFDEFLLECLRTRNLASGLELLRLFEPHQTQFIARTSYSYHAVALHSLNRDWKITRQHLEEAHDYGYRGFWQFDPTSHGWGNESQRQQSEKYQFLKELYSQPTLLEYVRSKYTGRIEPWRFDIKWTPFCWLEEGTLGRAKAKCIVSGGRLTKGDPAYIVRYFNGSFDVPTDPFYIGKSISKTSDDFLRNKSYYENDQYPLKDFCFKVAYNHPAVNAFWHRLNTFDIINVLELIATPPVAPTPYLLFKLNGDWQEGEPVRINSGTGGEFLNLLWVLIKAGHLPDILKWLPKAPAHFPVTLFLFDRPDLRKELIVKYLKIPALVGIYELLAKKTLSPDDIVRLITFGREHPEFQEQLAQSLSIYEYHLYSNYHVGANWFYWELRNLAMGHGGRLLYLLASRLNLLPVYQLMRDNQAIPEKLSVGAWDAYGNMRMYFYKTFLIGMKMANAGDISKWRNVKIYGTKLNQSFEKAYDEAMKIASKLT